MLTKKYYFVKLFNKMTIFLNYYKKDYRLNLFNKINLIIKKRQEEL